MSRIALAAAAATLLATLALAQDGQPPFLHEQGEPPPPPPPGAPPPDGGFGGQGRPGGGPGGQGRPGGGPGMNGGRPGMGGGPGMQRGPGGRPGMGGPGMQGGPGGRPGMGGGPGQGPDMGGQGAEGGPRGSREGGMMPPPPDWTPDASLASRIRKSEPEFGAALDRWKESEPPRWRGELWRWDQEHRFAETLRGRGETERASRMERMGSLERKVRAQIDVLPAHDGEARNTGLGEIRASLMSLFDVREEMRREEIAQLESRIGDLKKGLVDRRARKDEIVDRRLKELLGSDDPLGW